MELDAIKVYELITDVRKEIVEFKANSQTDYNNLRLEVAVMKNTQEQMRSDVLQLKNDVSNIKQYNSQEVGEKNKSTYFKDKVMWPIIISIIMLVISPLLSGMVNSVLASNIQKNQTQQCVITPTPTPR